jgi:hypothetical protein
MPDFLVDGALIILREMHDVHDGTLAQLNIVTASVV